MKRTQLIIGIVLVAAGAGIYALVKLHGEASGSDEAKAEESVPSVVTVQTGALKQMTLHHYVSGYGTVEAAPATADQPAAGAQLAAPSAGVVAKVNVIAGQQVQKGDVLVELNAGTATFDNAQAQAGRQKKLYEQQNTSLKNLQDAGVQDVRAYFEAHPEEMQRCADLIKVVDINRATLEMYEAESKEQLLKSIASVFSPESYPAFKEAIIALAEGQT